MMPLARILAATAIVTGATPALGASHHEWQGFSETVPAGSAVERELGCGDGSLVSGGYLLDNVGRDKGPFSKITPVANGPTPDGTWRVGFFNDHDTDLPIDFRISILCE